MYLIEVKIFFPTYSIRLRRILLSPAIEKVSKESADYSTRLPTCNSNPKRQKLPSVKQLAVLYGFFIVWVPSQELSGAMLMSISGAII